VNVSESSYAFVIPSPPPIGMFLQRGLEGWPVEKRQAPVIEVHDGWDRQPPPGVKKAPTPGSFLTRAETRENPDRVRAAAAAPVGQP